MKKRDGNPLLRMVGSKIIWMAAASKVKGEAEVIFFDAAGTLIRLERPVGWHYAEVARRHGLNADEERMDSAFREVWGAQPFEGPLRAPARTMIEPGGRNSLWTSSATATSSAPGIDRGSLVRGALLRTLRSRASGFFTTTPNGVSSTSPAGSGSPSSRISIGASG